MITLLLSIVFALAVVAIPMAQAQTFTVIHNFTGAGGISPWAGLTMDAAGNFYGTTYSGGTGGGGAVFKLKHSESGWIFTPLYGFAGGHSGANPWGEVAIARDGTVYGSTYQGGEGNCYGFGCGVVFHLTPSATVPTTALSPWNETVLYRFTGGSDGGNPQGNVTFDEVGNIYGTASQGGSGDGVVYSLTPSGGGWIESVLYSPGGNNSLASGVIFDRTGNLYGESCGGGVYELSPSGSGWIAQTLYSFNGGSDGECPFGGLIMDASGNLYGTTLYSGGGAGGTAFELTSANGSWTFNLLYSFSDSFPNQGNFPGSWDKLVMDAAGNLYGTTFIDGAYGFGSVFKLAPSNGIWTYLSLHDFTDGNDGGYPKSNLVIDANGNLYGTASTGGAYGDGVVFEITP